MAATSKKTTKPARKPKATISDEDLLEAIKLVFPSMARKRTLGGIDFSAKEIKRFIKKAPKQYARMSIEQKRTVNLIDDAVKKDDAAKQAAEKAARTRTVNKAAEADIEARRNAFADSLAKSSNSAQSAVAVKGANKLVSRRLYNLAENYKRIVTQIAPFTSVVLTKMAAEVSKSGNAADAATFEEEAKNSTTLFKHQETNAYDVGLPAGSAFDKNITTTPFEPVQPYKEPDIFASDSDDTDADNEADSLSDSDDSTVTASMSKEERKELRRLHRKMQEQATSAFEAFAAGTAAAGDDDDEYNDNPEEILNGAGDKKPEQFDVQNPNGAQKKKRTRAPNRDSLKVLPMIRTSFSETAFLSSRYKFSSGFFNGAKKAGCLGISFGCIDTLGSGVTTAIDNSGESHAFQNEHTSVSETKLDFFKSPTLLHDFAFKLASNMGMSVTSEIVPKLIMPAQLFNYLRKAGMTDKYRAVIRSNADSTGAFGFMLFAGPAAPGSMGKSKIQMVPFGILAATSTEITTLCNGDFANITDDKLFLYVAKSVFTNGLNTRGRVFGFSIRERSLMLPARDPNEPVPEKIVKLPNGKIMFLPGIDRRNELADFRATMQLPESLDGFTLGDDGKTDMEKFRGAVVYVDLKNNVAFYYSMAGKLQTKIYKGACDLNDRDRANLMKRTPAQLGTRFDITSKEDRAAMSPYGASTDILLPYFDTPTLTICERLPKDQRAEHGFPGVSYAKALGGSVAVVRVLAEDLRTSWNGDKTYYNMVKRAADNMLEAGPKINQNASNDAGRAYMLLDDSNGGFDDMDFVTASGSTSDTDTLTSRDLTALFLMLSIARKSKKDWPDEEILNEKAEAMRVRPPQASDLDEVAGKFDGLIPKTPGGNDYYEFMPHQAYIERTLGHQRTAALDCDMGGGKTLMSCLDATRWIKKGIDGKPARPCILMPASLIHNYMADVSENFMGKNLNFFVLSSSTRGWAKMDQRKIKEVGKRAPVNTFYVCSYEFLGLDSYQIVTGMEQRWATVMTTDDKGKKVPVLDANGKKQEAPYQTPIMDTMFPNAQLLLDLGINVIYLDESQKIKNKSSSIHKAVQALSSIPVKRIMTGTMVTRDVDDVFTQTSFIDGTMMGTRKRFQINYCDPKKKTEIVRGLEKTVRRTIVESGVMQVRRSMWMDLLPKKVEKFEFVDMDQSQGLVYTILMQDVLKDNSKMMEAAESYYGRLGGASAKAKLEQLRNYLTTVFVGANADNEDSEAAHITEAMRSRDVGDDDENENEEDALKTLDKAGRGRNNTVATFISSAKQSIAVKASMLQAFISAPQALKPQVFSEEAQRKLEMMNSEMPKVTEKDRLCFKYISEHFEPLTGKYIPMSKQISKFGEGDKRIRGKVIIFALNIAIVEHVYAYLKTTPLAGQVGIYIKQGEYAAKREQNLDAFKDPENTDVSILVAAETSVIYGQNMQAGDLMLKLTLPWTTGDYDQAVARIYRNGQKKSCMVVNVITNGSFEVGKLAKFLIRENSNRKIISSYNNQHDLNAALGTLNDASTVMFQTKEDIENLKYPIYAPEDVDKENPIGEKSVNCLELHDDVYRSELTEAVEYSAMFKKAGYGTTGKAAIPMASGNPVIDGETDAVRPRDPDTGEVLEPGSFKYADQQFFAGENLQRAREAAATGGKGRATITAEIKQMRARETADRLGLSMWQVMDERQRRVALRDKVQECVLAILAEHDGFRYLLKSPDLGEGTDESGKKRIVVTSIVNALLDGKPGVLNVETMTTSMFSEEADTDDWQTILDMLVFSRLVYNMALSEFEGTVAIDTTASIKTRRGEQELVGINASADAAKVKKNARALKLIMSGHSQLSAPTEKTGTQVAMENERKRNADKKAKQDADQEDAEDLGEDVDNEDEDTEEIDEESDEIIEEAPKKKTERKQQKQRDTGTQAIETDGLVVGVAELVDVEESEVRSGRNVVTNDSIYVFAAAQGNKPKWLKKLAQVKVGLGRSASKFTRNTMWVYSTPVTDVRNITTVAKKIESLGGFVEKVGTGNKQKYALVEEPSTEALFRVKAPANFKKFDSDNMFGIKQHVEEAAHAARSKAVPEVELGLLMFDRRIFLVALSMDTALLTKAGFRRLDILRVDFENNGTIKKQLDTCFRRIREAGIPIINASTIAKKLKIITKQVIRVGE